MKRRDFLKSGAATGVGLAGAGVASFAAPAIAQDRQRWKMVTSWPKNLPGPGTAANELARRITALSGGRLEVEVYGAGEIVPGKGVFDAVGEGTAELYHSVPAYWGSKSVGIELFGSQPFGHTAPEQSGWMNWGGGQALYDEMYGHFGIKPFLCGNSGPQWFGWFRKEINSVDDLRGLRYRTTGLNSKVMSKLGVAVQAMGGGEAFQAMQSGAIDAAEFIGPWTDSAIGFQQLTDLYYWPGIGEPSSAEECGVNLEKYEALPDDLKEAVAVACQSLYDQVLTEYNTKHAQALIKLEQEHGTQVKKVPEEVLTAMGNAAGEVIGELLEHDDELVRRITQSFLEYRNAISAYMVHADGGIMNARALDYGWPKG